MNRLLSLIHKMAGAGAVVSGLLIFACAGIISFDVVTRKLLNWTLGGANEIAGYLFAITTVLAWSYCALHRGNIRVDALYMHFSLSARSILDVLGLIVMFAVVIVLTYTAAFVPWSSYESGSTALTPLATPLVIPQSLWFAGLVFYVMVLGLLLVKSAAALVRGELVQIARVAGSPSVEDEVVTGSTGAPHQGNS